MRKSIWLLIAASFCLALNASEGLSASDRQKMDHMIEPLASWSLVRLGIHRKEIERRGKATSGIPIIQALGYLFSANGCRAEIQKIKKSNLKWKNLAAGYAERLKHEHSVGALLPLIDDFAKQIDADPKLLHSLIEQGDFIAFFDAL